ncbi:MAG: hypothetical protein M3332_03325 [Actinomycetota bacterium]|jgi:hypothetical protein|nr:hypothetical protein [Actinomycetota bacterium]
MSDQGDLGALREYAECARSRWRGGTGGQRRTTADTAWTLPQYRREPAYR